MIPASLSFYGTVGVLRLVRTSCERSGLIFDISLATPSHSFCGLEYHAVRRKRIQKDLFESGSNLAKEITSPTQLAHRPPGRNQQLVN